MVYHANQDPADAMTLEELQALDGDITALRDNLGTLKSKEKLLRAGLLSINAQMSTEELRSSVSLLELEKKELLGRLEPLRSGNVKPVSLKEKETVENEWSQWSRKSAARKKICIELWDLCTDEVPEGKTRGELWVRITNLRNVCVAQVTI